MSLPQTRPVLSAARDKVLSVLANPTSGFNAQFLITTANAKYLDTGGKSIVPPANVDFSGKGRSFITEKVDINDYVKSNTNVKWPILAFWAESALPLNHSMLKRSVFAGSQLLYLDIHVSWANQISPGSFGLFADAYVDTLYATLNTPGGPNENALVGGGGGGIYYLNELSVRGKSAASIGGLGWVQSISTSMVCKIQY